MDNLCLVGLGLFGLLYLTSKKDKKIKEKEIAKDNSVFIDHNGDKTEITMAFMSNKYRNNLEWVIPENEVSDHPLHPFAGFDYMKLSTDIDNSPVFGRYMKLPEIISSLLVELEPSVVIGNTITVNNDNLTLVMCGHKYPSISAITLYFAENINEEELSVCKMKNIYKQMVKNYTCKKIIEPTIEWYNQSLWDDNTYLYKNLCGEGDTSTLETDQVLDTNVLEDSDTSEDDSDMTSMDNQTELEEIDDSDTSEEDILDLEETSMDNQTDLDKMDASDISEDDSNMTSMDNQTELDKFIDSITSEDDKFSEEDKNEIKDIMNSIDDLDKKSDKKSDKINLSDTSDMELSNMDAISATSYDNNSEMYKKKPKKSKTKPKKSKTKKSAPKKTKAKKSKAKKTAPKKSKTKKSAPKKKKSKTKKSAPKKKKSKAKKSKKNKKLEASSDLVGGSSSLSNTRKSILGRF
jgi:histone H1/5/RNA exonuclease 1